MNLLSEVIKDCVKFPAKRFVNYSIAVIYGYIKQAGHYTTQIRKILTFLKSQRHDPAIRR